MQPGVVATADTVAKSRHHRRGEAHCYRLIEPGEYAEALTATDIHLTGNAAEVKAESCDLLVYVRSGKATLLVHGETISLTKGSAALIRSGETFAYLDGTELRALEVCVPDISGPHGRRLAAATGPFVRHVQQGLSDKGEATGDRQYEVLYDASRGSAGATMFVGFIPTSGAPRHYHLYDEICQIVAGSGEFQVGDTRQPIEPGSTFLVTPRLLHSLVNERDEELWVLGTFRPEGSPAAAYYPDGTPAPGYVEV